jgi:indole-3-glycerol phosphate synthase
VLTEERHFDGSVRFLEAMEGCGLPLLRKDFLLDPLQIRHTASTPASAVLLLARLFAREPDLLRSMVRTALAEGLEPVVEVFGPDDLELARFAGAGIIQVNNRDLETLRVDRGVSRELVRGKRTRELWISASGTRTGREIREMADLGFDACLVGTSIMACPDPEAHLRSLAGHETCSLCGRGPAREEGKC